MILVHPPLKNLPPRVKGFLSDTEAMALRISKTVSISVVGMLLSLKAGVPCYKLIEEFNSHEEGKKKTKLPSGHVTKADTNNVTALCREIVEEVWVAPSKVRLCVAARFSSTDETEHYKFFYLVEEWAPLPDEVKAAVKEKTIELAFDAKKIHGEEGEVYETKYYIRQYSRKLEEPNKDLTVTTYDSPIVGLENIIPQGQFLGLAYSIPWVKRMGAGPAMELMNHCPKKLQDFIPQGY